MKVVNEAEINALLTRTKKEMEGFAKECKQGDWVYKTDAYKWAMNMMDDIRVELGSRAFEGGEVHEARVSISNDLNHGHDDRKA